MKFSELKKSLFRDLEQGRKVLCVFDLDSTLFDVGPRIQKILNELPDLPEIQKNYSNHINEIRDARVLPKDWGIKDALSRAMRKNPPTLDFHRTARDFWAQHFFSNEYLQFDHLVEGSLEFVQSLFKAGSQIAYLTGRDWQRMGPGTVEVLKKWNFPVPENNTYVQLAMKPVAGYDDAEFKCGWFNAFAPSNYDRLVFFENEPVIIHEVQKGHPHIEIVFVDTTHSGKAQPHSHWLTITSFKEI